MTLDKRITELKSQYDVLAVVDLDPWHDMVDYETKNWFRKILTEIHKEAYRDNERIIFTILRHQSQY